MRALISWGVYFLPSMSTVQPVPMWRLTDRIVRSGLVIAWRLATSPTRTSPPFEKATTDGVVRLPSELGITTGSPASRTLTTELVVPRSMPTALGMGGSSGTFELQCRRTIRVECLIGNFGFGNRAGRSVVGRLVRATVALLLALPLLAGACGDDDDAGSGADA